MQLLQDLLGLFKRGLYTNNASLQDSIPIMKTRSLPKKTINSNDKDIRPDIELITIEDFISVIPSGITSTPQTLEGGDGLAPIAWDYSKGYNAILTLGGSPIPPDNERILAAPTNVSSGDYGTLMVVQDVVGLKTLTLPASFKVVNGGTGAITITATPNAIDVISWVYDGTNFLVSFGLNFT